MIVDLFYIILSIEIFIFSILAHELGHLIAFRYYGIKPKLNFQRTDNGFKFIFNNISDFKKLNPVNKIIVYLCGVGFGWWFLWIASGILNSSVILTVFWAVVYIIGSKSDLKNMKRLWKELVD